LLVPRLGSITCRSCTRSHALARLEQHPVAEPASAIGHRPDLVSARRGTRRAVTGRRPPGRRLASKPDLICSRALEW
jgi:hypothetical protein